MTNHWTKENGPRLQGTRDLDRSKVQAPCIVRMPSGGYRLFYTGVGPAKPFPDCQGYILSAISEDGLNFHTEPGIRIAPQPAIPQMSLRVIGPTVTSCEDGRWRMYFEARGPANLATVICSAVSADMLEWTIEDGIRLQAMDGVGGPRYLSLPDGRGRLYCFASEFGPEGIAGGKRRSQSVISAVTADGLHFDVEPGYRLRDKQGEFSSAGITAAEVLPPNEATDCWTMYFSAWQTPPSGVAAIVHPSLDADAVTTGRSADFAAASIAADLSGFRSRIFTASSHDGLAWVSDGCVLEGTGYDGLELDAVHAEDMSLIEISPGRYRMYYAACDARGNWRIASAVAASSSRIPKRPS